MSKYDFTSQPMTEDEAIGGIGWTRSDDPVQWGWQASQQALRAYRAEKALARSEARYGELHRQHVTTSNDNVAKLKRIWALETQVRELTERAAA